MIFDNGAADCAFVGSDQVTYLVDGKTIVKKTIENAQIYRGRLPLGLKRADTIFDVLEKSKKLNAKFPRWTAYAEEARRIGLTTGTCIGKTPDDTYSLDVVFDANSKLLSITAMFMPN